MDKLVDYVKWIGALDFDVYPFREADALILCVISYFDVGPVFQEKMKKLQELESGKLPPSQGSLPVPGPVYVRDCIPFIEAGALTLEITGGDMGNREIFEAAARSRRFGDLLMTDYETMLQTGPSPLQFAAVTFHHPAHFSFAAFRGTDASLAGWKEDCMISFMRTEAQQMSTEYAEKVIRQPYEAYAFLNEDGSIEKEKLYGPDWYIGGHSKGGNQALYAACTISNEAWEKVTRVFLLDGPGLCPEVLDVSLLKRIDSKTTRIIPEFDVIGKLFEPELSNTRIVYSYRDGFMQHSLASWLVDHGDLAEAGETDPKARWLNETINNWISSISQEDRPVFIDELFDALGSDGLTSLDDLSLDSLQSALISLRDKSKVTRQILADLPKNIVFDHLIEKPDPADLKVIKEKTTKTSFLSWLKKSPLSHALMMLISGAACLLANDSIVQSASAILIFSLVFVQCGLTARRLYKNHWSLEGMRERIILSLVMIGLFICLLVKEQAMFLMGSFIFGNVCFVLSYLSGEKAVTDKTHKFLRVLHIAECAITLLYGISFLVIPSATIGAYAFSIGILLILDGLIRLVRYLVIRGRNDQLLSKT
ncbi:MAG: DUF2974 domain-containing protein [Firmicutes bacterium]|nr:DUF2974 domain-containing protein [Bacillota bacterium]